MSIFKRHSNKFEIQNDQKRIGCFYRSSASSSLSDSSSSSFSSTAIAFSSLISFDAPPISSSSTHSNLRFSVAATSYIIILLEYKEE
jgi:hypothetical protein